MKNSLFIFFLYLVAIACSADPSQSAFPKRLPVDKRAEQEAATQQAAAVHLETTIKSATTQKDKIDAGLLDGSINNYTVRDGDEAFVAESTTYYKEEEKLSPYKTKIIYLTGGFIDVYWLADNIIWVHKEDYDYLFNNEELIAVLQKGIAVEGNEIDKQEVAKIPALAKKIINSPLPTTE
ncbi:hypothetical protein [Aureispira anguillae]|uniref:Lipoprotein n=1 Tax=Aureispira anguillae TaxID=2864201 RepID=A0A915YBJ2_9BACT|nr:hypothetical protein [Aureispira anguillae]BDS10039.1 hypothetical protein AsAng_0007440 [Aureispira anguillae]